MQCNKSVVSPHLFAFFFLIQRKAPQVNLQNVISTQKQPRCKKGCDPMQNSPELLLLKVLSLTYHRSHFLAATCISKLFS